MKAEDCDIDLEQGRDWVRLEVTRKSQGSFTYLMLARSSGSTPCGLGNRIFNHSREKEEDDGIAN